MEKIICCVFVFIYVSPFVLSEFVSVPCQPSNNPNDKTNKCKCYDILDDQCVRRVNSTMKECDPNKPKPCEDCFFCKKDISGKFLCHPVNKDTVKSMDDAKAILRNFESLLLEVKDVNNVKSEPSIGYGFNLNRPGAKKDFQKALPGVDFDKVKNKKAKITRDQALKLFNNDFDTIYLPRAKKAIGEALWDKLPFNKKYAIISGLYRGDLGPKTITLIKAEKWKEASKEYLNHDGYRNAAKNKMGGIIKRMDCNAKQFKD